LYYALLDTLKSRQSSIVVNLIKYGRSIDCARPVQVNLEEKESSNSSSNSSSSNIIIVIFIIIIISSSSSSSSSI